VGFHHPCHLHREQKVLAEPRLLLAAATGEAPLEPPALACCGMGGGFGVMQPALSQAVAELRLGEFRTLGAGLLTTACSGCLAQFQAHGEGLEVCHFLELVAPALEKV
jgi:Fe-S oxidoreductase